MAIDDEIRAGMQSILSAGEPEAPAAEAAPAPPATTEAQPAAPAETPAAAAPPAPAAPVIDEQTSRKLALSRQAQQQAQAERHKAAAERAALAAELAEARAYKEAVARAKARRDVTGLAKAHGIEPAREDAEALLAENLGKDAPAELQTRVRMAQLERQLEAMQAQQAEREKALQEQIQQQQAQVQEQQRRAYVRSELLPQIGDQAPAVRALAGHARFGDGVINSAIARFQAMTAEQGEVAPVDAFRAVHDELQDMVVAIMSDPVAAASIQKALAAKNPTKPQPAPPAEKTKPAPTTIGKTFSTSTAPPAEPASSFEEQRARVRAELQALRERGEL